MRAGRNRQARMWAMLAESLNTYAQQADNGEDAPGHSPASPLFWFAGLARELRNLRGTSFMDLLTPSARGYFERYTA